MALFVVLMLLVSAVILYSVLSDSVRPEPTPYGAGRTTMVLAYDDAAMVVVEGFATVEVSFDSMRDNSHVPYLEAEAWEVMRENRYLARRGDTQRLAKPRALVLRFRTKDGEREETHRIDCVQEQHRLIIFHDEHAPNAIGWRIDWGS